MSFLSAIRAPRARKLLGTAVGLVGLWAIVGFFLLPPLVRPIVERKLADKFDRQAFHDFLLAQGLLPPALMRKAVMDGFVAPRLGGGAAGGAASGGS